MGSTLYLKCRDCDYSLEALIGIGMQYGGLWFFDYPGGQQLLRSLLRSSAQYKYVRSQIEQSGTHAIEDYGHWLYRCPGCGHLCERFYVRIDSGEQSYRSQYSCPCCKQPLEPIQEEIIADAGFAEQRIDLARIPCPQCEGMSLKHNDSEYCLWD